jgi:hypothetical protein
MLRELHSATQIAYFRSLFCSTMDYYYFEQPLFIDRSLMSTVRLGPQFRPFAEWSFLAYYGLYVSAYHRFRTMKDHGVR